jgi:hypothetical protein
MIGQPGPPAKRPTWARTYDVGQLFDKAVQLYRRNFVLFGAISLVAIVPDAVLLVWGISLPTIVLRLISAPFILATFYLAAAQAVFRGPIGPLPILRAGVTRYRNFAGVLAGYLAAAFTVASSPAGISLIVAFGPTACVLAAESGTPAQAFKRWNYLLKKNTGRAALSCSALFLLCAGLAAVLAVLAIVGTDLIPSSHPGLQMIGQDVTLILPVLLTTPLAAIGYCLVYVDLRVRVEGDDLDDLARSSDDAA